MKSFFMFALLIFLVSCKSQAEKDQQAAYEMAFNTCENKWNANDTQKNTALLIVRMEFQRMDQLSIAPTDSYRAIRMICEVEAKKAKAEAIK